MKFYLQSDDCCSVCDGEGLVRSKDPLHRTPSDNDIKFALGERHYPQRLCGCVDTVELYADEVDRITGNCSEAGDY